MRILSTALGALGAAAIVIASGPSSHAAEKILRIGAPLPLTGPLAPEGGNLRRGYELWADTLNGKGGIKVGEDTYKVELVLDDYQSNTPRAVQLAERLIVENKVDVLFAPMGSGATKAASSVAEKCGVPMLSSNAASEQVYDQGFKYLFGLYTPNSTITEPMAEMVSKIEPKIRRIAILARNDFFPTTLAAEITESVKKRGFEIVSDQKFPIGTVDFGSALTQIRSANPDWIYVAAYINDNILIRNQMVEQGLNPKLLTMIIGPTQQTFVDSLKGRAENITASAWWDPAGGYKGEGTFESATAYSDLFLSRNNHRPDYGAAAASACGVVLELAVKKAGGIDRKQLRDAIAALDVDTFYGRIKFGPNGQIVSLKPPVLQLQGGKNVIVYPSAIKQSDLRVNNK